MQQVQLREFCSRPWTLSYYAALSPWCIIRGLLSLNVRGMLTLLPRLEQNVLVSKQSLPSSLQLSPRIVIVHSPVQGCHLSEGLHLWVFLGWGRVQFSAFKSQKKGFIYPVKINTFFYGCFSCSIGHILPIKLPLKDQDNLCMLSDVRPQVRHGDTGSWLSLPGNHSS